MENFYIFLENYILEMSKERNISVKNIKEYILRAFSNFSLIYYSKNNAYNICRDEIETILNTYNTGEIIIENIDIQSNIIKEILSGNIKKSGTLSVNGYEEYIFNLINGDPKKLDIALKNNFIKNKSELIKIVNRTKDILDLSECSFNLMKNILLKGEYSQSELPTIPEDVEEGYRAILMSVKFWLNDVRNNIESTNPISYISQKTPPFLLMHGDADTLVLPNQTEMLHKALIEKGVDSKRYIVPGAGHSDEYWFQTEVTELIIDFLNEKIKNI